MAMMPLLHLSHPNGEPAWAASKGAFHRSALCTGNRARSKLDVRLCSHRAMQARDQAARTQRLCVSLGLRASRLAGGKRQRGDWGRGRDAPLPAHSILAHAPGQAHGQGCGCQCGSSEGPGVLLLHTSLAGARLAHEQLLWSRPGFHGCCYGSCCCMFGFPCAQSWHARAKVWSISPQAPALRAPHLV